MLADSFHTLSGEKLGGLHKISARGGSPYGKTGWKIGWCFALCIFIYLFTICLFVVPLCVCVSFTLRELKGPGINYLI